MRDNSAADFCSATWTLGGRFFIGDWKILATTEHSIWNRRRKKLKWKKEKKKKMETKNSHAGNRTPATAVRAPDPNH